MRSILVLRGGALGDFIVTLPALAALRQQSPDARIELVGNATAAELARNRRLVDAVHSQHEQRWSALFSPAPLPDDFAGWLREFDVVVSFWPDPDGDLRRRFPLQDAQRFISAPAMPTRAPAATHYVEALRPLGIAAMPSFFALEPPHRPDARIAAAARPIAIHPGSGSSRKNWPASRWLEVIGAVSAPVRLIVGEAEMALWNPERLRAAGLGPRLDDGSIRVAANLPLETLVGELTASRLFLGHDSGVSHLAAAGGVPCVLLFGPTDPAMWAAPAPHVRVIQRGADLARISTREVLDAVDGGSAGTPRPAGWSIR